MYVLSFKEECFWVWRCFKLRWFVSKCTWNMGWHLAKGTATLLQSKLFHVACRSSSTTVGCRKQVSNSDIVLQSLNPGCHVSQWMQLQRKLQHHITTDCNRRVDDWKIQKREQVLPFVKVRKLTEYHNLMNSFGKHDHITGTESMLQKCPTLGVLDSIDEDTKTQSATKT